METFTNFCFICKKNRTYLENVSAKSCQNMRIAFQVNMIEKSFLICDKCNFHLKLVAEFMEGLISLNFPHLRASTDKCYSCHSEKVCQRNSIKEMVQEIQDFYSSPKAGAMYLACFDCMYKTRCFVKYKNLLKSLPHEVFSGPVNGVSQQESNCVDVLFKRMKESKSKKKSRKQKLRTSFEEGASFSILALPKMPELHIRLTRIALEDIESSPRRGRPIKRKLDEDFEYDMEGIFEESSTVTSFKENKYKTNNLKLTKPDKIKAEAVIVIEPLNQEILSQLGPAPVKIEEKELKPQKVADEEPPKQVEEDPPLEVTSPDEVNPPLAEVVQVPDEPEEAAADPAESVSGAVASLEQLAIVSDEESSNMSLFDADRSSFKKSVSFSENPPDVFYYSADEYSEEELEGSEKEAIIEMDDLNIFSEETKEPAPAEDRTLYNIIDSIIDS